MEIWYLAHSGFAVKVSDHILIFDYYLDDCDAQDRSLSNGVVNPEEIKNNKVYVFSSHRHSDHFNPIILAWKERLPSAEFFLSSDIRKKASEEWIHFLKPNQIYDYSPLRIQTFKSTDAGVAFLVTINEITIYHAGDLNWWHWEEESKAWNRNMEVRFKREISLMNGNPIDLAFLPVDPRLGPAALWGAAYFLECLDVKTAFPMHFGDDYSIMNQIEDAKAQHPVLSKIQRISHRGQCYTINI